MNTIKQTQVFSDWLDRLKDRIAEKRIVARIRLAENGSFGDHHFCADGIWEMRIHHGPGYRIYYAQEGSTIYLLLVGGDKRTQSQDIEKAIDLWEACRKEGLV